MVVGLLFSLTLLVVGSSYQTNDDPLLAMIVSGTGISLAPDEHLIFTNVAIGQVLSALYRNLPALPWYALYLYLAQYLSQVALLHSTIASGYSRIRLGAYLLFYATIGAVFLTNLQFTTTAALTVAAGLLLCIGTLGNQIQVPVLRRVGLLAGGMGLAVFGSLIRLECFYMMALVAIPAGALLISWRRSVLLAATIYGFACLAGALAFAAYNDAHYAADPAWQEFLQLNPLRVKFNDYAWTAYTPETQAVFDEVQWSKNDHAMISNWFYDDPLVFGQEQLAHVLNRFPWQAAHQTPGYWWSCVRPILRDRSLYGPVLAMPFLLCCGLRWRREQAAFIVSVAIGLALLVGVAFLNKAPPSRVYFPVLVFPALLVLLTLREQVKLPKWRPAADSAWARGFVIAAAIGVMYAGTHQYRRVGRTQTARAGLLQVFAEIPAKQNQLLVIYAPGFPFETLSPWDNLSRFRGSHQLILGWPQRTPFSNAIKQRYGITDLASALFRRDNLLLMAHPVFHPLLEQFIAEHHAVQTQYIAHHSYGPDLTVGHVRSVPVESRSNATLAARR